MVNQHDGLGTAELGVERNEDYSKRGGDMDEERRVGGRRGEEMMQGHTST